MTEDTFIFTCDTSQVDGTGHKVPSKARLRELFGKMADMADESRRCVELGVIRDPNTKETICRIS